MKRIASLLFCGILAVVIAQGQVLDPPTKDWCIWAFCQLPDHRDISKVDSTAFSSDFFAQLKTAFAIHRKELHNQPGYLSDGEFLAYWYAENADSPLTDPKYSIRYDIGNPQGDKVDVNITITTPSWGADSKYHRYKMSLIHENGSWRIDDWLDKNHGELNTPMRKYLQSYLGRRTRKRPSNGWFSSGESLSPNPGQTPSHKSRQAQ